MAVITITKDNFAAEVLGSELPVLLDFWASWCGPCRQMSPVIDRLADSREGTLKVGKVNTDEEAELSQVFGIMSIPTIVYIKDGEEISRAHGAMPEAALISELGLN